MSTSATSAGTPEAFRALPAAVTARHAMILRWLADEGRVEVQGVADRLSVAQETVRRDLRMLESGGRLQRVHGGAVPVEINPFSALAPVVEASPHDMAVARLLWADLPRTGTLLLGAGPLTLALISVVGDDPPPQPGLTIVSNSLDAAIAAARVTNLSVYNVGGAVSPGTRAQEGAWALQELEQLQVDISIVCPAGINLEHGLGQRTPASAAISRAEVDCGQRVIVLAGAEVLGRRAFLHFASCKEIDTIMLAGRPDEATLTPFLEQGIEVVVAEAPDSVG